jgi:hypothetical protein
MKEIFLLSMPRAGSTMLMRSLNQAPEILLYGEHGGFLKGFADAYFATNRDSFDMAHINLDTLRNTASFPALINGIKSAEYKNNLAEFIQRTLNPYNFSGRWGFKEVKYGADNVFRLLIELFPDAQFVLLIRNPLEQIVSRRSTGWWMESFKESVYEWRKQTAAFRSYKREHPGRCRLLTYESVTGSLESLENLVSWLGLPCRPIYAEVIRNMPKTGAVETKTFLNEQQLQIVLKECMPMYLDYPED